MAHKLGPGIISGVVSEDGIPKAGAIVSIYDRDTGSLVKRVPCGPAGEYTVSGLNPLTDSYYVVAKDDDGATRKNALIQDYVQPINGAVGSSYDANWYIQIKKLSPMFVTVGLPRNSTGQFQNIHVSSTQAGDQLHGGSLVTGSVTTSAQTTLLGAPNLQLVTMASGHIRNYGGSEYYNSGRVSLGLTVSGSLFAIVDTTANINIMLVGKGSYKLTSMTLTSFVISVDCTFALANATLLTYTIPVGAGRSGLHSIGCVYDSSAGGSIKIILDGVEVASTTNPTERIPYSINQNAQAGQMMWDRLAITGKPFNDTSDSTPTGGNGKFVICSYFVAELTTPQFLELHNAFFLAQPPVLTGYAKEVALDYPVAFYPLTVAGKSSADDRFKPVNAAARMPHASFIDMVSTSGIIPADPISCPVLGEAGLLFNGTYCLRSEMDDSQNAFLPNGLNQWTFSMEAWIRIDQTLVNNAYIAGFKNFSSDTMNQGWFVTPTNTISTFNRSTANDTVSFTPALTTGVWYHVVVTTDRIIGEAKLYLNGTLVDTKATGLTSVVNSGIYGQIVIGGDVTLKTRAITSVMYGGIFGVAFYPSVLTAARIQAHYDSRLIA